MGALIKSPVSKWITFILSCITLVALGWTNLAEPRINCIVEERQKPVIRALRYNEACHMAAMTSEQRARADSLFRSSKQFMGAE